MERVRAIAITGTGGAGGVNAQKATPSDRGTLVLHARGRIVHMGVHAPFLGPLEAGGVIKRTTLEGVAAMNSGPVYRVDTSIVVHTLLTLHAPSILLKGNWGPLTQEALMIVDYR